MLQRLYVNNFRCLENFEFTLASNSSVLLIGKNGTGKSTLARVLKIFQSIGRGVNRMSNLVQPTDCTMGRTEIPMRFEFEVLLNKKRYSYTLVLDLPEKFREFRVKEERLQVDDTVVYSREQAQVLLLKRNQSDKPEAKFTIDWHLVALPIIGAELLGDFRQWLAHMVILAPIPQLITGDSNGESLEPVENASNFADWITGLLAQYPSSYGGVSEYLKSVMPDVGDFRNMPSGKDSKSLMVRFLSGSSQFELSFSELSDGEKCIFLCAVVLAANKAYGPLFTFWDEPDNYLSMPEVEHFIRDLRRNFEGAGQIIVTSHNAETIRCFSDNNTFVLGRKSHLEPTQIRLLGDLPINKNMDIASAFILGELDV